jgi:polysaccharide export outer membrane protein
MRNHSSFLPRRSRAIICAPVALVAIAFLATALRAQLPCPDGSDADALGCTGLQMVPSPSVGNAATVNVEDRPRSTTPSADRSTEASATGSLSNGASYSDGEARSVRKQNETRSFSPEPATDFQNFVLASTGQSLPVYGAKLFTTQPASFGPVDHGPAPAELVIGPDDELRIRIWGQVNFSANLRVSREGEIYLPKVGAVHVAGMPFSVIPAHLRSVMERVYRNFELSVDVGDIHTIQIYVTGMARQPGEYTVSALSSLVDALFASGGPSAAGSMRHLQLKRGGRLITDFDLYALLTNGDKSGDAQLQSGDVLFIPAAGSEVALLGSVRQPAVYELRGEESLGQLIETAGGRTEISSGARLSIDRIESHERRHAFAVAFDPGGLQTRMADGDIVRIDPIISDYREAVTLRGAVANPGHFLWHESMRLSELLPERDALLRRDYWWQRTKLGLPAPQLASPGASEANRDMSAPVRSPAVQTNWNQAVIERLDSSSMTTRLIPFNLGKLVLDHDMSQDLELRSGDVITIYAQQDIQLPIDEQTVYVELAGEFVHPGVYSVAAGDTLRSVVARAGGFTGRAYLYGATFTRLSTRAIEQQQLDEYADRLEHEVQRDGLALANASAGPGQSSAGSADQVAVMNHQMIARIRMSRPSGRVVLKVSPESAGLDALPAMHLEDGDRFVVPFTPETIQVVGAVFNQQAFLFHDEAGVGQYLHMAGGPSRDADRRRMFVMRADGSVIGRSMGASIFNGSDFEKLRLYPGDAIIVPEKEVRPSPLNQLMIWSQFMSQMSLSALAVESAR